MAVTGWRRRVEGKEKSKRRRQRKIYATGEKEWDNIKLYHVLFCLLIPAGGNICRLLWNATILLLFLQEYDNEFRQIQSIRHAFETNYSAASCCYVKFSEVYRQKVYRINMCSFSHTTHACVNEGDRHQVTKYQNQAPAKMRNSQGDGWDKKDREQTCSQTISYKRTSRALICSKSYREYPEAPSRTFPTLVKHFVSYL
jgi:hypothetical protein